MPRKSLHNMAFSKVYPLYVQKVERKNRTRNEVDRIVCWLTGYSAAQMQAHIDRDSDFETFFTQAPGLHPNAGLVTGVICGVRVEEIEDPVIRNIRTLDKLIDELAKGRAMEKILRA